MFSLTLALGVICAAAVAVESARVLGVLALALLVMLHPMQTMAALLMALGLFAYVQTRRK